jgi:threonine aldolase
VRNDEPIDFRSDTVTKPDDRMRAAMAAAEVDDDVLGADPTMRRLEDRCAELLGTASALWVPSGSMGNLIALMVHLHRGERFLAPKGAHVLGNELGTAAWLAGGMPEALDWADGRPGRPSPDAIAAAGGADVPYYGLRTSLLCLENTHNVAGGTITPPDEHARLVTAAKDSGLTVHLDGARIWHAAVALGVPPAALTVGVDTVQACLSKALGAPVGSVVAGSAEFVVEARRVRKMLGGGVRQGGVLAAAGLVALDRMAELAVDNDNAATLAAGLAELGWTVNTPQTNIVLASIADAASVAARLAEIDVRVLGGGGQVRFITHRDVPAPAIAEALRRIKSADIITAVGAGSGS